MAEEREASIVAGSPSPSIPSNEYYYFAVLATTGWLEWNFLRLNRNLVHLLSSIIRASAIDRVLTTIINNSYDSIKHILKSSIQYLGRWEEEESPDRPSLSAFLHFSLLLLFFPFSPCSHEVAAGTSPRRIGTRRKRISSTCDLFDRWSWKGK